LKAVSSRCRAGRTFHWRCCWWHTGRYARRKTARWCCTAWQFRHGANENTGATNTTERSAVVVPLRSSTASENCREGPATCRLHCCHSPSSEIAGQLLGFVVGPSRS
jgi:hypothetical protein